MLERGDYINISFQDQPRHKKPIGIYWLQSLSAYLFGKDNIASYRLVSVLGALGAVLALFVWLKHLTVDKYFFALRRTACALPGPGYRSPSGQD